MTAGELLPLVRDLFSKHPEMLTLEPTYAESVRRYNARQEEANRSEWGNFHQKMAQLHAWLSQEHAQKARRLTQGETANGR